MFGETNVETPQNCCENEKNPRVFILRQVMPWLAVTIEIV